MSDLGLPFQGPIPIAKDIAARMIIAHARKIMRNVQPVAITMLGLQGLCAQWNCDLQFNWNGT
jgi:hypothetical protein